MTETELEQAIRDYIVTLYKACYIGWLKVEKFNPGYRLSLGIPSYMFPTTVAGDWATDADFLNYVYEDLRVRNYMRVYFYKVYRTTGSSDENAPNTPVAIPEQPSCCPNYTDYDGMFYRGTPSTTPPPIISGFTFIFPIILT